MGNVCVVIPARGGSVRIPRKNLQLVGGIELVAYPLRIGAEVADVTIVSTDSEEIARVARSEGAQVEMRPEALCGPNVTLDELLVGIASEGDLDDILVVLLPTCPFVGVDTIRSAVSVFCERALSSAVAGLRVHEAYRWKVGEGFACIDEKCNSQVAKEAYLESGAFTIVTRRHLVKFGSRKSEETVVFPVTKLEAFDIDDQLDLAMARRLAGLQVEP